MVFRKAVESDLSGISGIYDRIHTAEEQGKAAIGWVRDVYPTDTTAKEALQRSDLFVAVDDDVIVGTAIINQLQPDSYRLGDWEHVASDDEVMVLHTLVIDPGVTGKGYGTQFVKFYEDYALAHGCRYLRMDTQVINSNARTLYKKLGYKERGVVPCVFNGIAGVQLVLLEKKL